STAGVIIAADGSFSAVINPAAPGDVISITATDAAGASSGVVRLGVVPFGSGTTYIPITTANANNDSRFRARHMAIDGSTLAVVNYLDTFDSNQLLVFSTAGGTPVLSQSINTPPNTRDVAVRNQLVYVATVEFYVYDLLI